MPKSRSANSTIKGYFYQLDHFILQLLKLENEGDSITVEGIEDVDVHTTTDVDLIQCKYYEGTEYNHSIIVQSLRYMYDNYISNPMTDNRYSIYGYYKNGQDKLTIPISIEYFKEKFLSLKAFEGVSVSDEDLRGFINRLRVNINAKSYDVQESDILSSLKMIFKCNDFTAENHYYNNAIRIVKELSVNKDIVDRTITKRDFLDRINTQEVLFNQWFIERKGIDKYCKAIRKEYFTKTNISPFERFFLLDIDDSMSIVDIKALIMSISRKYSKLSKRESTPFCPYVFLHNVNEDRMIQVLKSLVDDDVIFIDGYDYRYASFSAKSITRTADHKNSIKVKIIYNLDDIQAICRQISKMREIYQFHIDKPFYENTDHKHIKIPISKTSVITEII